MKQTHEVGEGHLVGEKFQLFRSLFADALTAMRHKANKKLVTRMKMLLNQFRHGFEDSYSLFTVLNGKGLEEKRWLRNCDTKCMSVLGEVAFPLDAGKQMVSNQIRHRYYYHKQLKIVQEPIKLVGSEIDDYQMNVEDE
jgi:hypothetical protein